MVDSQTFVLRPHSGDFSLSPSAVAQLPKAALRDHLLQASQCESLSLLSPVLL